jgi:hypothetical protein
MSAFLRPIKSLAESTADDWERPISSFSFKVRNSTAEYDTYVTDPSFDKFNAENSGWGFPEFLALPLDPTYLGLHGQTEIEIEVIGTQSINKNTLEYSELVSLSGAKVYSKEFGPNDFVWKLLITNTGQLSCHLVPCLSDLEKSLGADFNRRISSFTLKFHDADTSQPITSKSLTGGFEYTLDGEYAGWDNLLDLNQSGLKNIRIFALLTWDPFFSGNTSYQGKFRRSLSISNSQARRLSLQVSNAENQLIDAHENFARAEKELFELRSYCQNLENENFRLKDESASSSNHNAEQLRQKNFDLLAEIEQLSAQISQNDSQVINFYTLKDRILQIRLSMEESVSQDPSIPPEQYSPHLSKELEDLNNRLIYQMQLNTELQIQVATSKAEVNEYLNEARRKYFERVTESNVGPVIDHGSALETARNEIVVAKEACIEAEKKIIAMNKNSRKSEKVGLCADLTMTLCGVDVAHASLLESYEQGHCPDDQFETVCVELVHVSDQILAIRRSLEVVEDASFEELNVYRQQNFLRSSSFEPLKDRSGNYTPLKDRPASEMASFSIEGSGYPSIQSIVDLIRSQKTELSLEDAELWSPNDRKSFDLEVFDVDLEDIV